MKDSILSRLLLTYALLCTPLATHAAPSDWSELTIDMQTGIEDRTSLLNDFFNDEAPQYHPTGWQIPNSRFMAIAQGSHLLSDHNPSSVTEWQDRHQHRHEQWTDLVLEGNPSGKWRYFINTNVTEKEMILDEAYINISLGSQWQLKLGQFFSAFGRLNSQHIHDRDFVDAPMIYQRLFGTGTALQEKGLQLTYSPILNLQGTHWIFGSELLSTTNRDQFNQDDLTPSLHNLFSRWGQSWGQELFSSMGISWAKAETKTVDNTSNSNNWQAVDVTIKQWLPQQRYWMLQGEWLNLYREDNRLDTQTGYYLMGLYRMTPEWRFGIRKEASYAATALPDTQKQSLILEYDPTTWSRIRLQFGHEQQEHGIEGNYVLLGWQAGLHWLE